MDDFEIDRSSTPEFWFHPDFHTKQCTGLCLCFCIFTDMILGNSSCYPQLLILCTSFLSKSHRIQMWFVTYEFSKSRYQFQKNVKIIKSREKSQMHAVALEMLSNPVLWKFPFNVRFWYPPIRRDSLESPNPIFGDTNGRFSF